MPHSPRPNVIEKLAKEGLAAMDGTGIDDVTAGEVLSAIYTMCRNATSVILDASEGAEKEHNRDVILAVVCELYDMVKPKPAEIN